MMTRIYVMKETRERMSHGSTWEIQKPNRRDFLTVLGAGVAGILTTENSIEAQTNYPSPEIPIDSSIVVPTGKIRSNKPGENLFRTSPEAREQMQFIVALAVQSAEEILTRAYESQNSQQIQHATTQFFQSLGVVFQSYAPEPYRTTFNEFLKNPSASRDANKIVEMFNGALVPAGLFLGRGNGEYGLYIHPLDRIPAHVLEYDEKGETLSVPVMSASQSIVPNASGSDNSPFLGVFVPSAGAVVMIQNSLEAEFTRTMKYSRTYGISSSGETDNEIKDTIRNGFLQHEGGHALLFHRFPSLTSRFEQSFGLPMSIQFGTQNARMQFPVTPQMLHECACVGLTIAASGGLRAKVSVMDNLSHFRLGGLPTYGFVEDMLPMCVLSKLPESAEKQRILQGFMSRRVLDLEALRRLVAHELTEENTREIGTSMYRIGYDNLRKIS
jgi:hypothetical protein